MLKKQFYILKELSARCDMFSPTSVGRYIQLTLLSYKHEGCCPSLFPRTSLISACDTPAHNIKYDFQRMFVFARNIPRNLVIYCYPYIMYYNETQYALQWMADGVTPGLRGIFDFFFSSHIIIANYLIRRFL